MNRLSVLGLVASDMSYWRNAPDGVGLKPYPDSNPDVGFPPDLALIAGVPYSAGEFAGWTLIRRRDDASTGFGAAVFKNTTTNEYIVALEGTDGLNGQDWYNNLNYGKAQWTPENRDALIGYLVANVAADSKVLFTGQSLGGALAQFAVYDYALRKGAAFDSSKVSEV